MLQSAKTGVLKTSGDHSGLPKKNEKLSKESEVVAGKVQARHNNGGALGGGQALARGQVDELVEANMSLRKRNYSYKGRCHLEGRSGGKKKSSVFYLMGFGANLVCFLRFSHEVRQEVGIPAVPPSWERSQPQCRWRAFRNVSGGGN